MWAAGEAFFLSRRGRSWAAQQGGGCAGSRSCKGGTWCPPTRATAGGGAPAGAGEEQGGGAAPWTQQTANITAAGAATAAAGRTRSLPRSSETERLVSGPPARYGCPQLPPPLLPYWHPAHLHPHFAHLQDWHDVHGRSSAAAAAEGGAREALSAGRRAARAAAGLTLWRRSLRRRQPTGAHQSAWNSPLWQRLESCCLGLWFDRSAGASGAVGACTCFCQLSEPAAAADAVSGPRGGAVLRNIWQCGMYPLSSMWHCDCPTYCWPAL